MKRGEKIGQNGEQSAPRKCLIYSFMNAVLASESIRPSPLFAQGIELLIRLNAGAIRCLVCSLSCQRLTIRFCSIFPLPGPRQSQGNSNDQNDKALRTHVIHHRDE